MKALIVEDHPPTAQVLSRCLTMSGHDADLFPNAEDAIDRLEQGGIAAYPLIILDLDLPGMDGISLCRWIRSRQETDRFPYVIVGTGAAHTEELSNAMDAGADDYIEKPYTAEILLLRFAVAGEQITARNERMRLNAELDHEKEFIAAVFDTAAALIVALDPAGRIVKVNRATCELTGLGESALEKSHFCETLFDPGSETDEVRRQLEDLAPEGGKTCRFETQFSGPEGQSQSITWLCRSVTDQPAGSDPAASKPAIVCVGTDITERRKMEAQLAFLAERDPLTNLYNRSQLEPALGASIKTTRAGDPAALIYLDLDDFKTVNDSSGHAAGDELLQLVATTLTRSVRPDDTVIRLGGDEFVLILNHCAPPQTRRIAARIRAAIDALAFNAGGRDFHVTASIGAVLLNPEMTVEEAMSQADAACYASKNNGRNTITFASDDGHRSDPIATGTEWHGRLREALAREGFELWLQPITPLRMELPALHEALLRMKAEGKYHPPAAFLTAARRFNLLPEIDRAVIRMALAIIRDRPDLNLTVNLSGRSVGDSRLPEFLIGELREAGVHPSQLLFEITESDFISDLPNAIERLGALREQGFRFAIDDFGQGYSSFSYLRKLPVEMVKIDGSYTMSLLEDDHSAAFIRAITDLAHSIDLRCVAEHVENAASLELLRTLEVDYAQGYHLGRPRRIGPGETENPAVVLPG